MKLLTKILFALLLIAGASRSFAKVQDRHITGFNAISLSASFDVYITQGNTESVKVNAPASVLKDVLTEVNHGMLNLRIRNHTFNWGDLFGRDRIIVYVTVKSINRLNVSGSGDVFFKDGLSANSFELRLSGSGDVMGRLNVNTLNCGISGSGDIKLSGRANSSAVDITGSGDFSARDLITTSTMIRVSGSGDAGVNASQQIDAHISGSGDIHYTGGARRVSSSISGSGDITRF